jgi:hypothetical protein
MERGLRRDGGVDEFHWIGNFIGSKGKGVGVKLFTTKGKYPVSGDPAQNQRQINNPNRD